MRFEYFEYLIEIARRKNMKSSSEHLHMTPQALSVCVKNMERELGFDILIRHPKGVELTEEGQIFLRLAERIVHDYYKTLAEIRQNSVLSEQPEEIQIYATPIIAMFIGGSLIERFQRDYPYLSVDIIGSSEPVSELVRRILAAERHNCISVLTIMPDKEAELLQQLPEEIILQDCFDDEVVLAAAKDSRLTKLNGMVLADLKGQTVINCTDCQIGETPLKDTFSAIEGVNYTRCNSINLWSKMIGKDLGIGPIIKRAAYQALREGDIDREKISIVQLDNGPWLRCICLYHQNAPEYVHRIVSEIRQL